MRGVTIGIFILCVSVFGTFMAAPGGVNDALGVDMKSGLDGPAKEVSEDMQGDQKLAERGGQSGMLGFAVYGLRVLKGFFNLYTSIGTFFATFAGGRFMVLWNGMQMLAVVSGVLMLVWVARGLIGE